MMLDRKKNIERRPKMAHILEKKTIKGSFVIEKTAGTESTAKIKSVNSMMISTKNKGVSKRFPSLRTKKRSFT